MKKPTNPTKPTAAVTAQHDFCSTINFMDCLSQGGFSEISSIAKLALSRLETPDGYQHLDDIANALAAIWGTAERIQNCINSEAELVGCNYVDDAQRRRWDAQHAHRETVGG